MSDSDERQSDLAVMDSNEYKQKRRLERILDAHDGVEEKISEAQELFTMGEIGSDGRNVMILQAVQQFLREIINLVDDDDPEHIGYWHDAPLRGVTLLTESVRFEGLYDILYADELYHDEITETVETPCGSDIKQTRRETFSVPKDVSIDAFLLAKQFLAEQHDLKLQFEGLEGVLEVDGIKVVPDDGGEPTNGHAGK